MPAGRRCRNLEKNYAYVSYDGQCWWMAGLAGALGDLDADGAQFSERLREYRDAMGPRPMPHVPGALHLLRSRI